MFGQEVTAREGATYYESADLAGSGRQGIANNRYTTVLRIAGFAQVDAESGRLIDYRCYLRDNVPVGEEAPAFVQNCTEQTLYIATYTDGFTTGSVGWFCLSDLSYNPGELDLHPEKLNNAFAKDDIFYYDPEQTNTTVTPENVADAIQNATTSGQKTALFLDASGSVDQYSSTIASYAQQIDHADYVAIFATTSRAITADEYSDYRFDVGGGTDIYAALNTLPDEAFDIVIIVTDTYHGYSTSYINERNDIGSVIILDPAAPETADQGVIDEIAANWHITPLIRRLNME